MNEQPGVEIDRALRQAELVAQTVNHRRASGLRTFIMSAAAVAAPFLMGGAKASAAPETAAAGAPDAATELVMEFAAPDNMMPMVGCDVLQPGGGYLYYDVCPGTAAPTPTPNPPKTPNPGGNPPGTNPPVVPTPPKDDDKDKVRNTKDNCPEVPNADQADDDGDGKGNVCDNDWDNDYSSNDQEAAEGSDAHNRDTDGDGVVDGDPSERGDTDGDGKLNVLESRTADADGDGTVDELDPNDGNVNVPVIRQDADGDGLDDSAGCTNAELGCDPNAADGPLGDADGDGVLNKDDLEPGTPAGTKVDAQGRTYVAPTTTTTTIPPTTTTVTATTAPATTTTTSAAHPAAGAAAGGGSDSSVPPSPTTPPEAAPKKAPNPNATGFHLTLKEIMGGAIGIVVLGGGVVAWKRRDDQDEQTPELHEAPRAA